MISRIFERVRQQADRHGFAPALDDGQQTLSYARLQAQADRLAGQLRGAGLQPGEPVVIVVANRSHDIHAFLALWQLGAVAVPMHQVTPGGAREQLLARVGNRFVIDDGQLLVLADQPPPPREMLQQAATIVFTSGSTGDPKGVVLGARAQSEKLAMIERMTNWREGQHSLVGLQLTFSFGQWATWATLANGGCVYLRRRFDAASWLALLASGAVDRLPAVPTMLRHLVQAASDTASGNRVGAGAAKFGGQIMAGGEPLAAPLGERVLQTFTAASLGDIYGLTETGTCDFFLQAAQYAQHAGTIGFAGEHIEWRIAPDSGELQIRSPWAMLGYLDAPDLTAQAFDGAWFKTGDLATVESSGAVRLIGRARDVIMKSGNKISPLEIEAAFLRDPAVAGALAVGWQGPDDASAGIHLAVVASAGAAFDEAGCRDGARDYLEPYKMPDTIHLMTELPAGATGKADRRAFERWLMKNAG